MTKARAPLPPAPLVSDSQYERELRELERGLASEIEAWRTGRRKIGKFIALTTRFWYDKDEAYFRCRLRNWDRVAHGPGRPPKQFRWFRSVSTKRKRRSGPVIADREATIVDRAIARVAGAEVRGIRVRPRDALVDVRVEEIACDAAQLRRLHGRQCHLPAFSCLGQREDRSCR